MAIDHKSAELKLHQLLSDRPRDVIEIALAARQLVHRTAKKTKNECSETIYTGYAISDSFSFTGKLGQAFIHIATYAGHVNLGFNRGTELPDPESVLEGTGKSIRHVKLKSKSDLKKAAVKDLVMAAVAEGMELAIKKSGIQEAIFVCKD